jgi:hypothetical protein
MDIHVANTLGYAARVFENGGQKMNWNAIGAISETVGAISVVVTLIYLARQVHQGTIAQNKGTYRSYVSELNRVLFSPMSDPEMMSLLQRGAKGFDGLSLRDQGVVSSV